MLRISLICILLCTVITKMEVAAQQKKSLSLPGAVKGSVRDTVNNYFLKSATASIRSAVDNVLISYQVTNSFGEFSFKNIPVDMPLRLEIAHMGYERVSRQFIISGAVPSRDLKIINLGPSSISLKEVEVSAPPITINGDTLEFNAAAFKLDSNAVVEDLLKKIPNITLWADGLITVNGKEIKKVLVSGKEFFGTNFKIATQNIPKNAVDKIQVYKENMNSGNLLDSSMVMDIKLKKNKQVGYFGKIASGYGTHKRYELDLNLNFFTPKMQLSVIGASNNTNKIASNINTVLTNSTFKGVGTNIDYQPNFKLNGQVISDILGASYSYNFIEKPTIDKKKFFKAEYFVQRKNENYASDQLISTTLDSVGRILDNRLSVRTQNSISHNLDSRFEWFGKRHSLTFTQGSRSIENKINYDDKSIIKNERNEITGLNNRVNLSNSENNSFNFGVFYLIKQYLKSDGTSFEGADFNYNVSVNRISNDRENLSNYRSLLDPQMNINFNRKYKSTSNTQTHQLNAELRDLKQPLFGKKGIGDVRMLLRNELKFLSKDARDVVEDFDAVGSRFLQNSYLTNNTRVNQIEDVPQLSITKTFTRSLANRFSRNYRVNVDLKQFLLFQYNRSDKSFQNITRRYSVFVPEIDLGISDQQFGDYSRTYNLKYEVNVRVPTLSQLAPLVDRTDLSNLFRGNINLLETKVRSLIFNFSNVDQNKRRNLNYDLKIGWNETKNNVVDSVFISEDNRRNIYLVNANGGNLFYTSVNVRKAFKFKTSSLQVALTNGFNRERRPNYLNGFFNFSKIYSTNTSLLLNYVLKDDLLFEANPSFSTYKVKQAQLNTQYNGVNMANTFSTAYQISKTFTVSSNITLNKSSASYRPTIDFTIWNASFIYRFLKGSNAELKISALDILRQNTNVINYADLNSYTIGSQNVLRNYFMTTLSYYPRQFGKRNSK